MGPLRSRGVRIEMLESRCLMSIAQVGGIGYLPSDNGTTFQRYDIANQQWLSPVTLANSPGGATATHVDADGIYVAYGRSVMRYRLDGTSPTHLINANDNVHAIHSDGNLLFANHSTGLYAKLISFDKNTNTMIDTVERYVDSVSGSSISTTANKIFGRTIGVSPSDITYAAYDDAGNFGNVAGSPYHGDYPNASKTWVFPLGTKVVDNSGTVYATSNLTRLSSFGTSITDIAFLGSDVPIVLSGNTLTAYTSTILPAASKTLSQPATEILVNSQNVIAFNPNPADPRRYTTQVVALSDLRAPEPGQPVNPVGLRYTPDKIELAADGTMLILDKETESIFRWNPVTQQYGATIPLVNVPSYMAYSAETNTIYTAYSSGLINKMDLGAATPTESPLTVLATGPSGLSTAGRYVFAMDGSGAWGTHYTFEPDGTQISAVDWNYYSTEFIWNAANSKMYFFRDSTSPNDLLWEDIGADGKIGRYFDSPLHDSAGFIHPIRVAPDGSVVILGSGMVHDGTTLARKSGGLGNAVSDIAWLNGNVYTIRNNGGNTQFQQWTGATFAPGLVAQVPGTPNALLSVGDNKLVAISTPTSGVPQFSVMDAGLNLSPPPTTVTQVFVNGQGLTGQTSANGVAFRNLAGIDNTFGYPVPAGANQTRSIPWNGGVDRIALRFGADVVGSLQQADLVVRGVNTPVHATSAFSYDAPTRTGVWTLTNPIFNDKVRLFLDDALVSALDGEWSDGADAYPSGNNTAGGDFSFRFNVLRGDATQDGVVNALDLGLIKGRQNRTATSPGTGAGVYSVFYDLNADGQLNALDLASAKVRLNNRLPAGTDPVATDLLFSRAPLSA